MLKGSCEVLGCALGRDHSSRSMSNSCLTFESSIQPFSTSNNLYNLPAILPVDEPDLLVAVSPFSRYPSSHPRSQAVCRKSATFCSYASLVKHASFRPLFRPCCHALPPSILLRKSCISSFPSPRALSTARDHPIRQRMIGLSLDFWSFLRHHQASSCLDAQLWDSNIFIIIRSPRVAGGSLSCQGRSFAHPWVVGQRRLSRRACS